MKSKAAVRRIVEELKVLYPNARCSLEYKKDYELLFAVRLSAQCTDARVNMVTPSLYQKFPTLEAFANATYEEVGDAIRSCGFYNTKSKDIVECAKILLEKYGGKVPGTMEELTALPGIGRKSAQRLAFHVLSLPQEEADRFANAVLEAKKSVHTCPVCQNLTDGELCPVCASDSRDKTTICVVSEPRDVLSIERGREYNGTYHVLHGVLSPMSHVGPDDIRIKELLVRVAENDIQEVIMATNPDTEGEATAMYLSRLLKPFNVKVTRLAYGIPVGSNLEFADDATLNRAIEGRTEV